jgi:hypothetical protein
MTRASQSSGIYPNVRAARSPCVSCLRTFRDSRSWTSQSGSPCLHPCTAPAPGGCLSTASPRPGDSTVQRPAVAAPQRGPFDPRSGPNGNPLHTLLRDPRQPCLPRITSVLDAPFGATQSGGDGSSGGVDHGPGQAGRSCGEPRCPRARGWLVVVATAGTLSGPPGRSRAVTCRGRGSPPGAPNRSAPRSTGVCSRRSTGSLQWLRPDTWPSGAAARPPGVPSLPLEVQAGAPARRRRWHRGTVLAQRQERGLSAAA